MATQEEIELGMARAKVLRLCADLARVRHTSQHFVLNQLMLSETWRRLGDPSPAHMNLGQAQELARTLERWIDQAKAQAPRQRHLPSKAPRPPWAARDTVNKTGKEETDG